MIPIEHPIVQILYKSVAEKKGVYVENSSYLVLVEYEKDGASSCLS